MLKVLSSRDTGLVHPLALARAETTRRIRSLDLCKHKNVEAVHAGPVNCLDIDPAEYRYLLSGGSNGRIAIHDLENLSRSIKQTYSFVCGVASYRHDGHVKSVEAVQWYPVDSGMFLSSSSDGSMIVWNTNTLMPARTFRFNEIIYDHHMSPLAPQNCLIAVGAKSPFIRLVDIRRGTATQTLNGHRSSVLTVKWSSFDEFILASGSTDGRVLLWDIRASKTCLTSLDKDNGEKTGLGSVVKAHDATVNSICFTSDGLFLVTFGRDNRVRVWDARSGKNTLINFGLIANNSLKSLHMCASEDASSQLLWVPSGCHIETLDVYQGVEAASLRAHMNSISCCVYQPRTQQLFTGGLDRCINVWGPTGDEAAYEEHLKEEDASRTEGKAKAFTSRVAATADTWSDDDDD